MYQQLEKMIENLEKFRIEFKLERKPYFLMSPQEKKEYIQRRKKTISNERPSVNLEIPLKQEKKRKTKKRRGSKVARSLTRSPNSKGSTTRDKHPRFSFASMLPQEIKSHHNSRGDSSMKRVET